MREAFADFARAMADVEATANDVLKENLKAIDKKKIEDALGRIQDLS